MKVWIKTNLTLGFQNKVTLDFHFSLFSSSLRWFLTPVNNKSHEFLSLIAIQVC